MASVHQQHLGHFGDLYDDFDSDDILTVHSNGTPPSLYLNLNGSRAIGTGLAIEDEESDELESVMNAEIFDENKIRSWQFYPPKASVTTTSTVEGKVAADAGTDVEMALDFKSGQVYNVEYARWAGWNLEQIYGVPIAGTSSSKVYTQEFQKRHFTSVPPIDPKRRGANLGRSARRTSQAELSLKRQTSPSRSLPLKGSGSATSATTSNPEVIYFTRSIGNLHQTTLLGIAPTPIHQRYTHHTLQFGNDSEKIQRHRRASVSATHSDCRSYVNRSDESRRRRPHLPAHVAGAKRSTPHRVPRRQVPYDDFVQTPKLPFRHISCLSKCLRNSGSNSSSIATTTSTVTTTQYEQNRSVSRKVSGCGTSLQRLPLMPQPQPSKDNSQPPRYAAFSPIKIAASSSCIPFHVRPTTAKMSQSPAWVDEQWEAIKSGLHQGQASPVQFRPVLLERNEDAVTCTVWHEFVESPTLFQVAQAATDANTLQREDVRTNCCVLPPTGPDKTTPTGLVTGPVAIGYANHQSRAMLRKARRSLSTSSTKQDGSIVPRGHDDDDGRALKATQRKGPTDGPQMSSLHNARSVSPLSTLIPSTAKKRHMDLVSGFPLALPKRKRRAILVLTESDSTRDSTSETAVHLDTRPQPVSPHQHRRFQMGVAMAAVVVLVVLATTATGVTLCLLGSCRV